MKVATILSIGAVLAFGTIATGHVAAASPGQSCAPLVQTDVSAAKAKKAKKMRKSRARSMAPPDPAGGDMKRGGPASAAPGGR